MCVQTACKTQGVCVSEAVFDVSVYLRGFRELHFLKLTPNVAFSVTQLH